MSSLVPRLLGPKMLSFMGTAPILILEGARAVGKTHLVREVLERKQGFHYVDLSDEGELQQAHLDLAAWVRSLPLPTIIDEAQLVPGLPLELKKRVDALGAGTHFVLTGSAAIGRTGLGGADPLARRQLRLSLQPLTRWEVAGQSGSLVDALFDGAPEIGDYRQDDDLTILSHLRTGGFPRYVRPGGVLTSEAMRRGVRDDITAILSTSTSPALDFNVVKARELLDALTRSPGGIFNATALGRRLQIDRRTVDRYLDKLGELFLLQWLPNLATSPRRQDSSRAKIHPIDTSLSVESLERAGADVLAQREYFGQLLESHVSCQILAHSQWSKTEIDPFYWRDSSAKSPEVDLVLRALDGREVAIEVKSSDRISAKDFRGIEAFSASREMHRGYVFYRGDTVRQFGENVWALPFSALSHSDHFTSSTQTTLTSFPPTQEKAISEPTSRSPEETNYAGAVFLSYVHKDDAALKGRIVRFINDVAETYALLFGQEIRLFTDQKIAWGDGWKTRLDQELGEATIMIAAVTPRYLNSQACRDELLSFSAAAAREGTPGLLLPLMWVDIENNLNVAIEDPVRQRVLAHQYLDVSAARRIDPSSFEYETLTEDVARRLHESIERRFNAHYAGAPATSAPADGAALLDSFRDLELLAGPFAEEAAAFQQAFEAIGETFSSGPILTGTGDGDAIQAMKMFSAALEGPTQDLDRATATLSSAWAEFDTGISRIISLTPQLPSEVSAPLSQKLREMSNSFELEDASMEQFLSAVRAMSMVSKDLRPTAQALERAFNLVKGIQSSAQAWDNAIG